MFPKKNFRDLMKSTIFLGEVWFSHYVPSFSYGFSIIFPPHNPPGATHARDPRAHPVAALLPPRELPDELRLVGPGFDGQTVLGMGTWWEHGGTTI